MFEQSRSIRKSRIGMKRKIERFVPLYVPSFMFRLLSLVNSMDGWDIVVRRMLIYWRV